MIATPNVLFARAHGLFDAGEYQAAASLLAELAAGLADDAATTAATTAGTTAGTTADALAVRLLLARAYYHSAQLHRAETETRAVLAADPANAYAYLLLGRTLQRQSRHDEARGPLRLAAAMGADQ